ncbi:MAG: aspartyl protease family protein [Bacilli bacterium]|nr:aspartyl protease family protein [Bacilli bacterium]
MPETIMKGAEELKAKFGKAPEDTTTKVDSIQVVGDVLENDSSIVIPLTEQDGVHYVTVVVCDIPMRFILDTGCSGIQISPIEYYYLIKQNKLNDNSILPDSVITTNAEGEVHKKVALIIPKIQVGNIEVSDIQAVSVRLFMHPLYWDKMY